MTLGFLFSAIRRYWYVLVVGVMGGALASASVGSALPKTYEASSLILLSAPAVGKPTDSSVYVRERMATYAELIKSEPVLERARTIMGTDASTAFLAAKVSPRVEVSTVLVTITASWENPQGAAALANAIARSYSEVAPNVDNRDDPYLRVSIVEAAVEPAKDSGLSLMAQLLVGSIAGLAVGLVTAILLRLYRPFALTVGDIREAANSDVLAVVELPSRAEAAGSPSSRRLTRRSRRARSVSFDDVYFHPGFSADGPHPKIVVVLSTLDGAHAAEVAWGIAETSAATGQRCLLAAADPAARTVLESHEVVPLQSRGVDTVPQLISPAAFSTSAGGLVSVQGARAVLHSIAYPGDLVVIAAPRPDADTNTRAFIKVAGSALIATPLNGSRTAVLRGTSLAVRNAGASVLGVVATLPGQASYQPPVSEQVESEPTGARP